MNDFIIFSNREKDASELLMLSQNIKLLSEILRVEKGNLTNEEYLKAEKASKISLLILFLNSELS